jgi:hypothetical protein
MSAAAPAQPLPIWVSRRRHEPRACFGRCGRISVDDSAYTSEQREVLRKHQLCVMCGGNSVYESGYNYDRRIIMERLAVRRGDNEAVPPTLTLRAQLTARKWHRKCPELYAAATGLLRRRNRQLHATTYKVQKNHVTLMDGDDDDGGNDVGGDGGGDDVNFEEPNDAGVVPDEAYGDGEDNGDGNDDGDDDTRIDIGAASENVDIVTTIATTETLDNIEDAQESIFDAIAADVDEEALIEADEEVLGDADEEALGGDVDEEALVENVGVELVAESVAESVVVNSEKGGGSKCLLCRESCAKKRHLCTKCSIRGRRR